MKPTLSRLERVPLRTYWQDEARDFTPWLSTEDNIALLGETIGIDLEVQEQEARVGPFRADILCRDTATDRLVLIENQLERTDHTHLGQLFTYAAGLDTAAVVWIAERFTEEHRAALDWLNRITHEGFHFFGIEVELWRIGTSNLAPKFNAVVKPNDWAKTVREASGASRSGAVTEGRALKGAFWQAFRDVATERGSRFLPPATTMRTYIDFGVGRTDFSLGASVRVQNQTNRGGVSVFLWINSDPHGDVLCQLRDDRDIIEAEIGETLHWEDKPERMSSEVWISHDADPTDRDNWPALHAWMVTRLEAFDRAFRSRIRALDLTEALPKDMS